MKRSVWSAVLGCALVVWPSWGLGHDGSNTKDDAPTELVTLVINLLGDPDKDVRALGFEQVRAEAKGASATRKFAAQLPKLSADAQAGLISALADRGDNAARPELLKLLASSNDEAVRVAALRSLGTLGQPDDLKLLLDHLAKKSPAESGAARFSLTRLAGDSVSASIAQSLSRSTPPLRTALIEILVARRATSTVPALLKTAVDSDPTARAAAMTALAQLAGPTDMAGLVQGVLKAAPGSERDAAEKSVMQVCLRNPDAAQRAAPLVAALEELDKNSRAALLPTLGRVGGPAARSSIEEAIASKDPAWHEIGIRSLCNWPDAPIAPRLMELTKQDGHPDHRIATLRALIRVAPLQDGRSNDERLDLLKQSFALATRDGERNLVLQRAYAIRTIESLRFVLPYVDQPTFAKQACEAVVELAHHRELRDANRAEFEKALDKVLAVNKDPVVQDRAQRYKKGQTWVRPK